MAKKEPAAGLLGWLGYQEGRIIPFPRKVCRKDEEQREIRVHKRHKPKITHHFKASELRRWLEKS